MYRHGITTWKRLVRSARSFLCAAARDPASAYDLWSSTYDDDGENLLVALDERMFERLFRRVEVRGKCVVDVGCGTGRHWSKILAREPAALVGYDASPGMLDRLRRKIAGATVYPGNADSLAHTASENCDVVISTLALSHFASVHAAIAEWARVLRPGGEVLLTDLHPAAAATCKTTFVHGNRVVVVKTHVRSLTAIKGTAARLGLELLALEEMPVDESMRDSYEGAGMLHDFDRLLGVPLLYGMHLRKARLATS
jgi:ubiquinone/menaquinone biosynthesis C-methylase UbiE